MRLDDIPTPVNARELGPEKTAEYLRRLLCERFRVARQIEDIRIEEPMFSAGVGLSSMDGVELMLEIENRFGVRIENPEAWFESSPSVASVVEYLMQRAK